MTLGMEVGLGLGNTLLNGDKAPIPKMGRALSGPLPCLSPLGYLAEKLFVGVPE